MDTATRTRRRHVWQLAVPLMVMAAVVLLPLRAPDPLPASAPATSFSATRATVGLDEIAGVPHPTGSAAAGRVREVLVQRLRALDLRPEVITRVTARSESGRSARLGTVSVVHARIPGTQPTGRVLLVAHYDSVPIGPGASDNAANVAAILEVARALRAEGRPRNDVELLFTEGEEQGLLGAKAFVDSGAAGDPGTVFVVNLEARGVSGSAVMFQTTGSGTLSAVRSSGAFTTSVADAVYRILPNDTDLTVFGDAGMRGVNLAFLGGAVSYHTARDDVAAVSGSSVQSIGESALAATRSLAGSDLRRGGTPSTFFSLGPALVSYPEALTRPLAVIAVLAVAVCLVLARRGGLRRRRILLVVASSPLPILVAVVVWLASWSCLVSLRPDVALSDGFVHRPAGYVLAEGAVELLAVVAWYRLVRRRVDAAEVVLGILTCFALSGLALAVVLPGGAYLFTWPALVGSAVALVVLGRGRGLARTGSWAAVTGAVGVSATAVLLPVCVLLVPSLGLELSIGPLLLLAVLAAAASGVLEAVPRGRAVTAGLLALFVVSVSGFVGMAALGRPGPQTPRPVSLGYVVDGDTRSALWVSAADRRQPVVGDLLVSGPASLADRVPPFGDTPLWTGPAAVAGEAGTPVVEVRSDQRQGDVRTVQLRLFGAPGAYRLDASVDTAAGQQVIDASVAGLSISPAPQRRYTDGAAQWSFGYAAPPAEGVDVVLRLRGEGSLRIRAVSTSSGLPAGARPPAMTPDLMSARWPSPSGQTFAVRSLTL